MHPKFKEWFLSLDYSTQIEEVKKKAMQVNRDRKAVDKALAAELKSNSVRTGIRGGTRTTLQARAMNATDRFNSSLEELKYMTSKI